MYRYICISITAGEFLYKEVIESQNLQVAFVWNRSLDKVKGIVPDDLILVNLDDFATRYVMQVYGIILIPHTTHAGALI